MPNRYANIEEIKNEDGIRYRTNTIYPDIPVTEDDTYVITTGGDRYDTLANQFYGNPQLWWIIASANVSKNDGLICTPGIQLRIPADSGLALRLFNEVNANR